MLKILVKKMFVKKIIFCLILCSITITKIYCQQISLDTSFGSNHNGTVITSPADFGGTTFAEANSIGLQSTGKIVASGEVETISGTLAMVARYTKNGLLDTTFGTGGSTQLSSVGSPTTSLAVQTDDKVVIGYGGDVLGNLQFVVARVQANGALDSTFGSGGFTQIVIGVSSFITSVKIQSDGKIVAGGRSTTGGSPRFALARFNTDGTVDTSFGSPNGFVTFQFPGATNSQINSIAIQSDGKIVAAGRATIGGVIQFAIARFNTDGSVEWSTATPISPTFSTATSVVIQPDNKIVVGGTAVINGTDVFAFVRLETNGGLDPNFGIVTIPLSAFGTGTTFAALTSIALQTDGKIVAGGVADPGGIQTFSLARLNSNGSIDTSFGTNGTISVLPLTLFGSDPLDAAINSILIQSDGKIVAGGFFDSTTLTYFALARFGPSGCVTNLNQAINDKYGI